MNRTIVVLLLCLLSVSLMAQDAPTHKFFDKPNVALFSMHAGTTAWDAYETHNGLQPSWKCEPIPDTNRKFYCGSSQIQEANPLARPFVKTTAGQIAFFGGTVAANVAGAYLLHRSGHHRLERVVSAVNIGFSVRGGSSWIRR